MQNKLDLDTPALVVDLDLLEQNIAAMADFARRHGVGLRPHTKSHKTPAIAHLQMAAGATGICCATLGEAEVMAAAGLPDILITRPVVGAAKIERACGLSRHTRLTVVTDSPENADQLAAGAATAGVTLAVIMEVDVGTRRCGVQPASAEALALARRIVGHKALRFTGIQGYEGHLVLNPNADERTTGAQVANRAAVETARRLEEGGIPVPVITGGGTGTHALTGEARTSGYTEIQAGSYATMDASYTEVLGADSPFQPALGLLTTCVSNAVAGRAIVDAGLKSLGLDHGTPTVKGRPGLRFGRASEEHLILEGQGDGLKVGEVIELYPAHGCTTFNLHDRVHGIRGEWVEVVWPVAGRGRSW